ncbi:hypothetical protein ACFYY9_34620 [Streptomyces nigra]|uniref:hypothetical protein n=1 Tax=Streptomyces nigra TaxID=1827580 RepID=UPI0036622943
MDSMTHIYFAANLLRVSGHNYRAVDCSLFPQMDRRPAYYHRLYAHSIAKAVPVIEAANRVYWQLEEDEESIQPSGYFETRLLEERDRIRSYTEKSPFGGGNTYPPPTPAQHLAFVSHIYNDQFNNPVQAFAPFSVYPSGAWQLWEELGGAEFRWYLYDKRAIEALRAEVFAGDEWDVRIPAEALTAAMIGRLAKSGSAMIDQDAVRSAMEAVDVDKARSTGAYRDAMELLSIHDARLMAAMKRHSHPLESATVDRIWAGQGY